MIKSVFLDRDGVINELILNPASGEFEPPHSPDDLIIFPEVIESLRTLQNAGFELFLVSNQPDYAKGKTTLENIHAVHNRLNQIFLLEGIRFQKFYYCYHHPSGIIPDYSFSCECRKPKPYFIHRAAKEYGVDITQSWMIGDRDSDIECGRAAGTRTIVIEYNHSSENRGKICPDFTATNLKVAVEIIINGKRNL